MNEIELVEIAKSVAKTAYSPYSKFSVGAAFLTKGGKVYTGCNIENSSYSVTMCAERCALFKAVSDGEREFCSIAIVGGKGKSFNECCPPCGVCRQALSEFCDKDFKIFLSENGNIITKTLGELLPLAFSKSELM